MPKRYRIVPCIVHGINAEWNFYPSIGVWKCIECRYAEIMKEAQTYA